MFIFYKPDSGEIAYTIEGDEIPHSLSFDGLAVIEVASADPDLDMQYVEAGVVLRKPDRPGDWAVWNSASASWTDPRDAAEKRAAELATIKTRRDVAIEAGTMINGALMPTDPKSREMITGAAVSAMLDSTYTANWKMPDNTFMALDATQIIGIASAMRAHVQACYDREGEIISAIEAGNSYDIEAGWPN